MTKTWKDKFSIQLFAEGDPQPSVTEPTSNNIEIPEYINAYVSGIEDEGQKEYMQGLLKEEKGIGLFKNLIQDPTKEWDIKTDDYKDLPDDVNKFLEQAKENGFTEEQAKIALDRRRDYITREREAMTPELRQYDATIANFITAEKDESVQNVYARLAENAAGRKVLINLMELKSGGPTTSSGNYSHEGGTFNLNDWKERYNNAVLAQDESAKKRLKAEAMSVGGELKEYFNAFFRES